MVTAVCVVRVVLTISRSVLLSYNERNKVFTIPDRKDESDIQYLESEFRLAFSYHGNVSISISYQTFDADWNDYDELNENSSIFNKDDKGGNLSTNCLSLVKHAGWYYIIVRQRIRGSTRFRSPRAVAI